MLMFPQVLNVKAPISMMMLFGGEALGYILGLDWVTRVGTLPVKLLPL